jgi:GDP-L-fucose synthase
VVETLKSRGAFDISVKDMVTLIAQRTGFQGAIRWDMAKLNGQPRRKLDVSRADRAFGFRSTTGFEEGLSETIRWYENLCKAVAS